MPEVIPTALAIRAHCTLREGCRCPKAVFREDDGINLRRMPKSPDEVCICQHPWWMHIVPPPPSVGQGGCLSSHCGGYHPHNQGDNPTLCVCGQSFDLHEILVSTQAEANASGASAAAAAASPIQPNATEAAAQVARSPPARAFANVGNRSLHSWTNATAAVSTANRQRMEAAANHRPSKARRSRSQVSVPIPQVPSAASTIIQYNCAIWPFVLDNNYSYAGQPPPEPVFNIRELGVVVDHLSRHNLVFHVELSQNAPNPWMTIDRALKLHLDANEFQLKRPDDDDGNTFNSLAWDVLGQSKSKQKRSKWAFQVGLAGLAEFTTEFLRQHATIVLVQTNTREAPFLLLAPTRGNLRGPIPDGPLNRLQHACMPWRLLGGDTFKWLKLKPIARNGGCINNECPSAEGASSSASGRRRRISSPTVRVATMIASLANPYLQLKPGNAKRRRPGENSTSSEETSDSDIEMVETRNEGEDATTLLQDDIENDRADSPIDLDLYEEVDDPSADKGEVQLPRLDDIRVWQLHIRSQSIHQVFRLGAPSIELASPAFVHLVKSLISGTAPYQYEPEDPEQITCNIRNSSALLSSLRPFFIGKNKIPALGDGPSQSVHQGALDLRVKGDNRWVPFQGGAYRTLDMSLPPNLIRAPAYIDYETDGVLMALVMVQLLLEPYPVNPFLVYAAFFQDDSCFDFLLRPYQDYLPEHLLAMLPDKETHDLVALVLNMTPDTTLSISDPIHNTLIDRAAQAEIPAPLFLRVREGDEHEGIVRPLLTALLVGHHAPWQRRQFEAFQKGLRLKLCRVDDILPPLAPGETHRARFLYAFKLVATIWNHRILSFKDVYKRISCYYVCLAEHKDKAKLYAQLFLVRLYHWMRGKGHPRQLVGNIVSEADYKKSLKSPRTTRPALFWKAMTDSVVLPVDDKKDIEVRLKYMRSRQPASERQPLRISTCLKKLEVNLDPDVQNLLLEPVVSGVPVFDLWFHKIVATAANDYNAV
ncbi:hypothetical protein F5887DRAFT_1073440 [Amanita rubescens]|nr:hypothetical protein F5887DRAFT_1088453 [Amanita rubescens]KAF8346771.1 hypothetical protein F5887DRAFT_1073440 [Amanita rubescens]